MKVKITKSDGTIIEVEGTEEECLKAMGQPLHLCPPCTHICPIYVYPQYPIQTFPNVLSPHITWTLNPNISITPSPNATVGAGGLTGVFTPNSNSGSIASDRTIYTAMNTALN